MVGLRVDDEKTIPPPMSYNEAAGFSVQVSELSELSLFVDTRGAFRSLPAHRHAAASRRLEPWRSGGVAAAGVSCPVGGRYRCAERSAASSYLFFSSVFVIRAVVGASAARGACGVLMRVDAPNAVTEWLCACTCGFPPKRSAAAPPEQFFNVIPGFGAEGNAALREANRSDRHAM